MSIIQQVIFTHLLMLLLDDVTIVLHSSRINNFQKEIGLPCYSCLLIKKIIKKKVGMMQLECSYDRYGEKRHICTPH